MPSKKAKRRPRTRESQPGPATGRFSLPSWVPALIIVVASVVITFLLIREDLDARWGLLDDHEIMSFLGSDREATLAEFGPLLMSTEVGRIGTATRFRPSYYSMRIVETIAWGDSARLWYNGGRGFHPWSEFRPVGGFYSIGLSGSTDGLGQSLGRFW